MKKPGTHLPPNGGEEPSGLVDTPSARDVCLGKVLAHPAVHRSSPKGKASGKDVETMQRRSCLCAGRGGVGNNSVA